MMVARSTIVVVVVAGLSLLALVVFESPSDATPEVDLEFRLGDTSVRVPRGALEVTTVASSNGAQEARLQIETSPADRSVSELMRLGDGVNEYDLVVTESPNPPGSTLAATVDETFDESSAVLVIGVDGGPITLVALDDGRLLAVSGP